MEGFWTLLCNSYECSTESGNECSSRVLAIINPNSCIHNIVVIAIDMMLLIILLCYLIHTIASKKIIAASQSHTFSPVSIVSVSFNAGLALAYLGFGIWTMIEKVNTDRMVLPVHGWLVYFSQGFTWLGVGLTLNLKKPHSPHATIMKFFAIFSFLIALFVCGSATWECVLDEEVSVNIVLNILCFPGSILLLFTASEGNSCAQGDLEVHYGDAFYTPLPGEEPKITGAISSDDNVTPFAKAGLFSKMTFWWLNPLMKKGKEKILENEDIPQLREADRARTLHSIFREQLQKRKERHPSSGDPSVLTIIFFCQWKAILVSGFFALLKILAMTVSPLFLIAFIKVVDANAASRYEVYVLTAGLFFVKIVESLSERQWFFRTRLIGLQVRSLISAAVYQKQLRLSNAAKMTHSPGDIVNYVTVDAYRIGEFPFWFHQIWSTNLQLFLSLLIIYFAVGAATVAAVTALILTVVVSSPLAKLQHEYQTKFMIAQKKRLKAMTEALSNMKILKLYSWEKNFKKVIEELRVEELKWISKVVSQKGYCNALFWTAPVLAAAVTFWTCYLLGFALSPSNVFTFLATLRILQEPIRFIPDVLGAFIEAQVSFSQIVKFLDAPELENRHTRKVSSGKEVEHSIFIRSSEISWDTSPTKPTLRNIDLVVKQGEKVAICGEVGSGKSTLLAAILGEVPHITGIVQVYGTIAYVSQSAWIETGTIQDNILFGTPMDHVRYHETLRKCSLVKDLDILPFRDLTQIGERGVNLSGGQKQRIQLARALYQNADVYLLDDPFSAVDAHTATSLFNDYVMGALAEKTVLLVTHQVDFLQSFDSILLMSSGAISGAAPYEELLAFCQEFREPVNAHNKNFGSQRQVEYASTRKHKSSAEEIENVRTDVQLIEFSGDQLIKKEERETGDTGFKPCIQYLKHGKGFLHFSLSVVFLFLFIVGQLLQNFWLALNLQDYSVSRVKLFTVYSVIFCIMAFCMLLRSFRNVDLGCGASESIFSTLLNSLFRAPMLFYDSTPLGRILSRVSTDMNIIDLEVALRLTVAVGATLNTFSIFLVMVFLTWPLLFLIVPTVYVTFRLQSYYFASSKELMRMNGTTKSALASHLSESIAGAVTIRAFGQEERFFSKNLEFIDANSSADFNSFSTNEWLIERLELLCAIVLSASAFAITSIQSGASSSGFIGMTLSYGLSLNIFLVLLVQFHCFLANSIISVERVEQYMHIPSEAAEVIKDNRPAHNWPIVGKVEIHDLEVRYRPNSPLVLHGINCIIEGGHKIGIVGRTGSGKTTLISVLFRLVEPTGGRVIVDGYDICTIGLYDLRSRFGIIPQDPTLFGGSVRYNLDPLAEHTDHEIWEVLEKCQLREAIGEEEGGLDSLVVQDGTNWSMGQRQLFCLGRALLKKSRILVLDEATASMDNATDSFLQKTIRTEFADCTVITVAHRIPTVMDCTKVLALSDGKVVEYDEPMKLMNNEGSLFGQLVKEYWSRSANASMHSEG